MRDVWRQGRRENMNVVRPQYGKAFPTASIAPLSEDEA
jgi:hypothetical protein